MSKADPAKPDIDPEEVGLEPWAMGMQPRDVMFVRAYLCTLNISQAARDSNYFAQSANPEQAIHGNSWAILRRPVILKAIAAAMDERAQALKITAQSVLGEAWRCYLMALDERNWTQAYKFLRLAGEHVGVRAFKEGSANRTRDDFEAGDDTDFSNLSDEELEQLARLTRKATGDTEEAVPASKLN